MRRRLTVFVACLLFGTHVFAAPPENRALADSEHQEAIKHLEKGKTTQAIASWEKACILAPHWKYAFNLMFLYSSEKQWIKAWDMAEKAAAWDIPAERTDKLKEKRTAIRKKLLETHALLKLTVTPEDARVTRNATLWEPPYTIWTTDEVSHLVIEKKDHVTLKQRWEHPAGSVASLPVTLVKDSAPPPPDCAEGSSAKWSQEKKRWRCEKDSVQIVTRAAPKPPELRQTTLWKWISVGSGVAGLGAGVGMLAWSKSLANDQKKRNSSPGLFFSDAEAYAEYLGDRLSREEDFNSKRMWGYVFLTVGSSLAVAGTVLFMLDADAEPETDPEATTSWAPLLLPGGGGLNGVIRF